MSDAPRQFMVALEQKNDYQFEASFDWDIAPIQLDEPQPLGTQTGPNAARLVAAAAANCLSASLLFCLQCAKLEPNQIDAQCIGTIERNARGRLRLTGLDVKLELSGFDREQKRSSRCLKLFEDFCVVTQSLRDGIDISVDVTDESGKSLMEEDTGKP